LEPKLRLGQCLIELQEALDQLEMTPGLGRLVPEVRSQIGYATPGAAMPAQVLAGAGRRPRVRRRQEAAGPVRARAPAPRGAARRALGGAGAGRITRVNGRMKAAGPILPGASAHVARVVLTAMHRDPQRRAAMALRYSPELVERARSLGWLVGEFDRAEEPAEVKEREGSTLEWGTARVIEQLGRVPDAIFDRGENGKEPILRILANDPGHIARMVAELAGNEG
jgi:hydroxymethylpyrimidine/phosphomethylpyrimidine kinase